MGRKKKYGTAEEKQQAAREAQRRYYDAYVFTSAQFLPPAVIRCCSHQESERAKARERWSNRGSAQRRARHYSPRHLENYADDPRPGWLHEEQAQNQQPEASTSRHQVHRSRSLTRSRLSRFHSSSDLEESIQRLYHLLRLGGETADENDLLDEQAMQFILMAQGAAIIPPRYIAFCASRMANASGVLREACVLEAEALRRDPLAREPVTRRIQALVRSATRHETFDEELGLFMRAGNGAREYQIAFERQELLWQQETLP